MSELSIPEKIEWFDVVDESDQVIGREQRALVHAKGLRHRAVHILLFNAKGEVFLQKRSQWKDMHPNTWDSSCSGHVDSGEDYDVSADRELGEELGLVRRPILKRLFKIEARPETGQEFVWVYRGECEGPFQLHPEEISEGRFVAAEELNRWIAEKPEQFAPAFRFLWNLLQERR